MDRRLAAVAVSRLRLGGGGTPHHTPAAFRSAARREQTFEVAPIIIVDFAEGKLGSEHADAGRERRKVEGTSTPKGATTRISLLFWSAVLSTITVRPALERSSATTLWIRAHCSPCAPGGVSQRICQSPWTDRTAPCAPAATVRPKNSAIAKLAATWPAAFRLAPGRRPRPPANGLPRLAARLTWCFQGLIGSIP